MISTAPFLEEPAALALLILLLAPLPVLFFVLLPVQHVILSFLAEDERYGTLTTLRISCYAAGAIALIAWIPLVDLLVVPHLAYVQITGLKRVHGVSVARALPPGLLLAALFCIPVTSGIIFEYRAVQEVTQEPSLARFYFPPPEKSVDLPPGITGVVALLDGSEDQKRVEKLRDASYADEVPSSRGGAMVTILTADPAGRSRGVSGYVHGSTSGSASETMRIGSEHPEIDREGTDHISYYASEHDSISPKGYYENPIKQQVLIQYFTVADGSYTLNLEQEGKEPRTISVTTYNDADTPSGEASFHVPYRVARPGDRLRLKIKPDVPLEELRLEIDRNQDGTYEESWMPEATIVGEGVNDDAPPVTTASVEKVPSLGNQLTLFLEAEDYSESKEVPPSGIGVIYYWINDSGPRIYMDPVPVETGDVITYWSVDRAGNGEWRRTSDVLERPASG